MPAVRRWINKNKENFYVEKGSVREFKNYLALLFNQASKLKGSQQSRKREKGQEIRPHLREFLRLF